MIDALISGSSKILKSSTLNSFKRSRKIRYFSFFFSCDRLGTIFEHCWPSAAAERCSSLSCWYKAQHTGNYSHKWLRELYRCYTNACVSMMLLCNREHTRLQCERLRSDLLSLLFCVDHYCSHSVSVKNTVWGMFGSVTNDLRLGFGVVRCLKNKYWLCGPGSEQWESFNVDMRVSSMTLWTSVNLFKTLFCTLSLVQFILFSNNGCMFISGCFFQHHFFGNLSFFMFHFLSWALRWPLSSSQLLF